MRGLNLMRAHLKQRKNIVALPTNTWIPGSYIYMFTWPGSVWTSARTRWNMLFSSSRRSSAQYRFFTQKVRQLWRKPLLGGGGIAFHSHQLNPYNAALSLNKSWRPKGFFQFEIIVNVLVISFRFIWIPMLQPLQIYIFFIAGTVFLRQNLTSTYVRFWRMKILHTQLFNSLFTFLNPVYCIKTCTIHPNEPVCCWIVCLYFLWFEAGIANAIYSFKWRKIIILMKKRHLLNWLIRLSDHPPLTIFSISVTFYALLKMLEPFMCVSSITRVNRPTGSLYNLIKLHIFNHFDFWNFSRNLDP